MSLFLLLQKAIFEFSVRSRLKSISLAHTGYHESCVPIVIVVIAEIAISFQSRLAHFEYPISIIYFSSCYSKEKKQRKSHFSGHIWSCICNSRKSHFNIPVQSHLLSSRPPFPQQSNQPTSHFRSYNSILLCAYPFWKCIGKKTVAWIDSKWQDLLILHIHTWISTA